jgi:phosphoserine phosphatase RsbU/P
MPAVRHETGQLRLFSRKTKSKPPIADIYAVSHPARTFTGDFYVTHRHDERIWLAHGDVAGKGLPAAIVMAMIQEELEHRISSCAAARCNPAATMQRLHEFLRPILPSNRFATAVIAHLRDDGMLTFANGGHCPPFIVRRDGSVEELSSTGPAVGILPQANWSSSTVRLAPGESLILYSDGIIESNTDLGVSGLRELVAANARLAPKELAAKMLDAAGTRCDDSTIVIVRRP